MSKPNSVRLIPLLIISASLGACSAGDDSTEDRKRDPGALEEAVESQRMQMERAKQIEQDLQQDKEDKDRAIEEQGG